MLPDGRLAGLSPTSNKVVASSNAVTWTALSDSLTAAYSGVVYEPVRGSFYAYLSDCGNVVEPNAIMRFDYKMTGVKTPSSFAVKNLCEQSPIAVVTGLHSASLLKGDAYDLRGVLIRNPYNWKTEKILRLLNMGVNGYSENRRMPTSQLPRDRESVPLFSNGQRPIKTGLLSRTASCRFAHGQKP